MDAEFCMSCNSCGKVFADHIDRECDARRFVTPPTPVPAVPAPPVGHEAKNEGQSLTAAHVERLVEVEMAHRKEIATLQAMVVELRGKLGGGPCVFVEAGTYAEEPGRDYRAERDAAYAERNKVVAGLAAMVLRTGGRAWLSDHRDVPGENWDPKWRTVVFIDGPTGQLSWHLHDSDVVHFLFLPRGENAWDGHSAEQKYNRIAALAPPFVGDCVARKGF